MGSACGSADVLRLARLFIVSPRTAGPLPRDVLQLARLFIDSPRTAGPLPRDVLQLARLFVDSPRTGSACGSAEVLRLALPQRFGRRELTDLAIVARGIGVAERVRQILHADRRHAEAGGEPDPLGKLAD